MKNDLLSKTEGEIVNNNVVDFTKKTTKRKNSGSATSTPSKRNDCRPAFKKAIGELFVKDIDTFLSQGTVYFSKMKQLKCKLIQDSEHLDFSVINDYKKQFCFLTKEYLIDVIWFYEKNLHRAEIFGIKGYFEESFVELSKIFYYYFMVEEPKEFILFIQTINPETIRYFKIIERIIQLNFRNSI